MANMKYEQLERKTLMNESSTFLCLHIVKKPTTYVFANAYSILENEGKTLCMNY